MGRLQSGPQRHQRAGEGAHHHALLIQNGLSGRRAQKAHVLGQYPVCMVGVFVFMHEAQDKQAQ